MIPALFKIAALLPLSLLLASQAASATPVSGREAGEPPASALAGPPANALELMGNLHDALHGGQAFDKGFYTEENVRKLTAARQVWVVRHQGAPERHEVAGVSFAAAGGPRSGVSFRLQLEIAPNGDQRVIVDGHALSEQPLLHAPAIEKLLGHVWKDGRQIAGSDGSHRQYRYSKDGAVENGHFKFTPGGLLENFVMIRKEPAKPGEPVQFEDRFDGGGFVPGRYSR